MVFNHLFRLPFISFTRPFILSGLFYGKNLQTNIYKESSWTGSAYNCSTASGDGGTQWAELNAEKAGALYQHVLVQPESTLYWHFSHRGRNGTDTMYMVIAPKNKISSSSSTEELVAIAKKIVNGEGEYTEANGNVASDKNGVLAERTISFGMTTETDGIYTKTVTFPNMPDDTEYTIKKILYFNGSTTVPNGYTHLLEAYAVSRNSVLEDKGYGSETSFMTYDEAKDKIHVDFVDRFEIQDVPVVIKKELFGNAVEEERDFSFTITGTLKNGTAITDEISDTDKLFTLKGGESKTVSVPFGSYITVSEEDCTDDSYATYHEIIPGETIKGNVATIPEVNDEKEILFTNKRVKATLTIKKIDEDGNRLAGATLKLYKGKSLSADNEIGTFTTDGINDWTMTLMNGDYTLVESTAPDGYRIANAIIVHVSESGITLP